MKRNYLFYFNWQMTLPFYSIVLDEIDKLISDPENQVYLLSCSGTLNNCLVNRTSDPLICKACRFAANTGAKPYRDSVIMLTISDLIDADRIKFPDHKYESIKDIKELVYRDCLIGYGALSSYVSYTRNQEPIIDEKFRDYFNDLLNSQILLASALEKLNENIDFDEVFVYNGRWADVRPVFDFFVKEDVQVNVMEAIGNATTSYQNQIFKNVLPQDIDHRNDLINYTWENNDVNIEKKVDEASSFFIKRKEGRPWREGSFVFTSKQDSNSLPENWNDQNRNITIFNSSEDEFLALGAEWGQYQIFENQEGGIEAILASFVKDPSIHFYIRIHPNLSDVKYGYHTRLYSLEKTFSNVTVISGDSDVSTYKLLEASEKVIVFGSTLGIEACYWRKPVILLGGTSYYFQNVAYIPKSSEETMSMIKDRLEPKPLLGALKFAYHLMNHELYTEPVASEPEPLKIMGITLGYGFRHMRIFGSQVVFKIVYTGYLFLIIKICKPLFGNSTTIPVRGK